MDPRARFEETLRKFGHQIGEVLELDEEGACIWDLGEDRECLVVMPEHAEAVVFCVNVAPVMSDAPERLFRHLLIMNYADDATRGAALGLTPEADEIVLRYTRTADGLTVADVEHLVGNLGGLAEDLGASLVAWQQDQQTAIDAEDELTPSTRNEPARTMIPPDYV